MGFMKKIRGEDNPPQEQKGFFKKAIAYIKTFSKKELKKLLIQLTITLIVLMLIFGTLVQVKDIIMRHQDAIYVWQYFTIPLDYFGIFIVIYIILNLYCLYYRILLRKDTIKDDRNFEISKKGTYGTAREMTEESYAETFESQRLEKATKEVMGEDKYNPSNVVTIRRHQTPNNHKMIIGCSGSMKTRSRVIPDIIQAIKRRESVVATDPKGEVYQKTAKLARLNGYNVKVLNLKPSELINSDGVNILSVVGSNQMKAQTISELIIKNTSGGQKEDSFFAPGAKALLTACILYTTMNEDLRPEERTIGEMYRMLSTNNAAKLTAIFNSLPANHPARVAFATFDGGPENGKASIWQGLLIRLQTLQDPLLQKILSTDGISFTELGDKPSIYYIIISDQESTLDFVTATFFNLLFIELVAYADKQKGMRLKVPVNMIMDEMPSIGPIPNMQRKLATVRSRGINITMIAQNTEQLEELYPNKVWKTIMSNCSIQMLLAANDDETALTFSKRSGEMTTSSQSISHTERALNPLQIHPEYQISKGEGKRYVYTPDEILTMPFSKQIVAIQNKHVLMLNKVDYSRYPEAKFISEEDDDDYMDWLPMNYIPEWRRENDVKDMEQLKTISSMYQEQIASNPSAPHNPSESRAKAIEERMQEYVPVSVAQAMQARNVAPEQQQVNKRIEAANNAFNKYVQNN